MLLAKMKKYIIEDPALLADWDYEKNEELGLAPDFITLGSNLKVWWKCDKRHPSYLMTVSKRARGDGCPVCSNHKIISGINDLQSNNPQIMCEWFWEKNNTEGIDPSLISSGSGINAWWKCKTCGNVWRASIVNRVKKHSGCPYCANLKVKKGFNDLATIKPNLAEEWDYDKNGDLKPDAVVACYSKKVWWKCAKCGFSWAISPNQRSLSGCPRCGKEKNRLSSNATKAAKNPLLEKYPYLLVEWDSEKNGELVPSQFAAGSEKKVWWKCEKGHSWKTAVNVRTAGRGCPYCSNKRVLTGYNDLATTNPGLAGEWDYEKNEGISPSKITAGSNKKVWWKCSKCGKSWQAIVYSRRNGNGCPDCARQYVGLARMKTMASKNPLFENHPNLEKEWDYEKNADLDISLLAASSNKFAWWKCEKGHSFRTRISSRTLHNVGCPYCHNQKVLVGENDLETLNPELASEWDYEKNYPLKPCDVFSHSSKHVWWKCPVCGNSWKAKVHNRANGRGCPNCNPKGTSFIEQTLYYYIKEIFNDAENRYVLNGTELDIYIPSKNIAIEYDGSYYHTIKGAKERENKKDIFCKNNGIKLIRLREKPLDPTDNAINISCNCYTWNDLENTCKSLIDYLNPTVTIDISIKRDYMKIVGFKKERLKDNSFGKLYPELLDEWDYEKNVPLVPDYFSRGSSVKVWWKCEKGHEWKAPISSRTSGTKCPYCRNRKVLKDYNDLESINPYLAREWNYEKNGELTPDKVTEGSNKRVWWKCEKGHEWQDIINNRKGGRRCPYCTGRRKE